MDRIVPISEARANLTDLVNEAADHEVYLLRHGKPVGVLVSTEAYERLLSRIEDLEDALSVHEAGDPVPFETSTTSAAG